MLVFPNCKINLGLYVTEKRADGYHNIESVFYPVSWMDALEILEDKHPDAKRFSLVEYGDGPSIHQNDHLIYKCWLLLNQRFELPPVKVHFLKNIPIGAGLGGGSSDAAFTIQLLDKKFKLNLTRDEKLKLASTLGSDCAFFVDNKPQFASGRGEILEPAAVDLSEYFILLVYPGIHSNTAQAYRNITPKNGRTKLNTLIATTPLHEWKFNLMNDFEPVIFKQHPEIQELKQRLYELGALYASMSGSGSTVYGIFQNMPQTDMFKGLRTFVQKPESILG